MCSRWPGEHGYSPRLASKQRNVVLLAPGKEIYPIRNCLEMVMMALTQELPQRRFRDRDPAAGGHGPARQHPILRRGRHRGGARRLRRLVGPLPGAAGAGGPRRPGPGAERLLRALRRAARHGSGHRPSLRAGLPGHRLHHPRPGRHRQRRRAPGRRRRRAPGPGTPRRRVPDPPLRGRYLCRAGGQAAPPGRGRAVLSRRQRRDRDRLRALPLQPARARRHLRDRLRAQALLPLRHAPRRPPSPRTTPPWPRSSPTSSSPTAATPASPAARFCPTASSSRDSVAHRRG